MNTSYPLATPQSECEIVIPIILKITIYIEPIVIEKSVCTEYPHSNFPDPDVQLPASELETPTAQMSANHHTGVVQSSRFSLARLWRRFLN